MRPAPPPPTLRAGPLAKAHPVLQVTALRAGPLRGARTVGAARGATADADDATGTPTNASAAKGLATCWACGPPRATATSARARIGRRRRGVGGTGPRGGAGD